MSTRYTAIDVSLPTYTGDAHLIQTDGENVMIDAGRLGTGLVDKLAALGVTHLDRVFITHVHRDHIWGLYDILDSSITIGTVYANWPLSQICTTNDGCVPQEIANMQSALAAAGVTVVSYAQNDSFGLSGATLDVLYRYDGVNTPVGETKINDTSAVMRLTAHGHTVLFSGDLRDKIGGYLAANAANLASDIMVIPHHGANTAAPNAYFDAVNPSLAIVSSPDWRWNSSDATRMRNWCFDNGVPVLATGEWGNISVNMETLEITPKEPKHTVFRAYLGSEQSNVAAGTETKILFNKVQYDTANGFENNGYTVRSSGWYRIEASAEFDEVAGKASRLILRRNGSELSWTRNSGNDRRQSHYTATVEWLPAGDIIEAVAVLYTDTNVGDIEPGRADTYLSLMKQ